MTTYKQSRLARIVWDIGTPGGRAFDLITMLLVIYSIITLSIETLPGLSPATERFLLVSEITVVLLFTAEYILRLATAPRKLAYVLSFYGIIDLLAVLPFYLSLGTIDARGLRGFRLFRLLLIFKLSRYDNAGRRFMRAMVIAREEIILFLLVTVVLLYLAATGIYYFEHEAQPELFPSIPHSLWWAVTTLTTVGYGDVYPLTLGGRLFTVMVLMIGLGVVAMPAGMMAAALSKARDEERQELEARRAQQNVAPPGAE